MSKLKKARNEIHKTCAICLSDINCKTDSITIKWACGHMYHTGVYQ